MTTEEHIIEVLWQMGRPMYYRAIAERTLDRGWSRRGYCKGPTPERSVVSIMSRNTFMIIGIGGGVWGLTEKGLHAVAMRKIRDVQWASDRMRKTGWPHVSADALGEQLNRYKRQAETIREHAIRRKNPYEDVYLAYRGMATQIELEIERRRSLR